MDIAKLVARLELQSTQFQTELEKTNQKLLGFQKRTTSSLSSIERDFKSFGSMLKGAFATVGVAFLTNSIHQAIEFGDEIGKAAEKAGIGAAQMSELAHAAKTADVELADLSTSIRKMQIAISQAVGGNKTLQKTFRAIGVDARAIKDIAPDEAFERIADGIAGIENPANRARAATELLGKSGAELLPLFSRGAAGIREAREEAVRLGTALSDADVQRLQEADDAIKALRQSFSGLATTLTAEVAPVLATVLNGMRAYVSGDFTKNLSAQLSDLSDRRNELVGQLRNMEEGWLSRFLLGRGYDNAVAKTRAQLAAVEQQMNAINSQLLKIDQAGLDSAKNPLTAPGFEPETKDDPFISGFTDADHERIRMAAEWRALVHEFETGAADIDATTKWITESFDDMSVGVIDATDEMSVFADEAARNIQDSFAENIFNSFDDGLDGMLKSFVDTLRRMAAEIAASQIMEWVGGKSGSEGVVGLLSSVFSGAFGGPKAKGGPLDQGKWYIAGEHGPEPIWGGGPGAFAMGYGQGASVTVSNHYDLRGSTPDVMRTLPSMLAARDEKLKADIIAGIQRGKYPLARGT